MNVTLNRNTAPKVLRMFDVCFKQGVLDASEYGDDLGAKEFYERKMEDWTFGVLGKDEDFEWQSFRFTLYWWARQSHLTKFGDNYIFKIRRPDNPWCLLPYCMRFYLMGVAEWISYPNPTKIEVFKGQCRVHWDPKAPVQKFTTGDYISYMHGMAYDYHKLPDGGRIVSSLMMDSFPKAIYDLTRDYGTRRKKADF